jgi:hypothetical protein
MGHGQGMANFRTGIVIGQMLIVCLFVVCKWAPVIWPTPPSGFISALVVLVGSRKYLSNGAFRHS